LSINEAEYSGITALAELIQQAGGCGFASTWADAILLALGRFCYARSYDGEPKIEWKMNNKGGKLGFLIRQPTTQIRRNKPPPETITVESGEDEWVFVKAFGLTAPPGQYTS
jgi:hypothetical protein